MILPDLPAVDHSFVLVQSEQYYGTDGPDVDKINAERPDAVAVVEAHVAYFDAIGAVGPPAAGDDVTDLDAGTLTGRPGAQRITVMVDREPIAAGIDPRNLLIDTEAGDLKFDTRGQRCLTYSSIRDLESKLANELAALLETRH